MPETQTAVIQSKSTSPSTSLPLTVANLVPIPALTATHQVLVRVLAVALNPNDHKMVTHFPMPGNTTGCDFCGVVEEGDTTGTKLQIGTRVCGTTFAYNPDDPHNGAFAERVVADARLLLKVPDDWSDLQGASLGGIVWGTVSLAFSDPEALALEGTPSEPVEKKLPVLVYGGATALGTMACQLLSL
jgi:NADPH:quinone reductase-like Zn-dependent oxidoreductase